MVLYIYWRVLMRIHRDRTIFRLEELCIQYLTTNRICDYNLALYEYFPKLSFGEKVDREIIEG